MNRSLLAYIFLTLLLSPGLSLVAQTPAENPAATPRIQVDNIEFGQWPVVAPTPSTHVFRIRNISADGGVLVVQSPSSGPSDPAFTIAPGADGYPVFPLTLQAGEESKLIRVSFKPTAPIAYRDQIVFPHNAGPGAQNDSIAGLNGEGIHSVLAATSFQWDRKRVFTGDNGEYTGTVTLTNVGNQNIQIIDAAWAGHTTDFKFDFAAVQNRMLYGGASVDIPVTFRPQAIGPRQVVITYNHTAGDAVVTSTLTGIGVEPTLGTHDVDFGTHGVNTGEFERETLFYLVSNGDPSYIDSVRIDGFTFPANPNFSYLLPAGTTLPYVLNSFDDTLRIRSFFIPHAEGVHSTTLTAVTDDIDASRTLVQATSHWNGTAGPVATTPGAADIAGLTIGPVAPTPTDAVATLSYQVPSVSSVEITLVDATGRTVATLLPRSMSAAGSHTVRFDVSALPAGSYFCRMSVGKSVLVQPLVVR